MSKKVTKKEDIQKKDVIQAVVICDNFNNKFHPITFYKPSALMPLINRPFLDYTLDFLSHSGVEEVILFSSSHSDLMKEYVKTSKWKGDHSPISITLVMSEICRSVGDAMRDLYAKGLIRGDFVLFHGTSVGNLSVIPLLEKFKAIQRRDKGAVIAMVCQGAGPGHKTQTFGEEMLIAADIQTNRVLIHRKLNPIDRKITFPLDVFTSKAHNGVAVRTDLLDTGIWLCSSTVPPLFADNFDYECGDDLVKGILMDEEIMQYSVYWFPVPKNQYAASAMNGGWPAYQAISNAVIHRWTFPSVPESIEEEPYIFSRHHIYKQDSISLSKGCILEESVVIGKNTVLDQNTFVTRTVIGCNCKIGKNVSLSDSFLWNNVVIEDDCQIESCILSEGCYLASKAKLAPGCILGPGVRIEKEEEIHRPLIIVSEPNRKYIDDISLWKQISPKAWIVPTNIEEEDSDSDSETIGRRASILLPQSRDIRSSAADNSDGLGEEDDETSDAETSSRGPSPPLDDANLFYNEVIDSLMRGFEDRLPCDNLCLEINSSRYAYNVPAGEVTWHVVRALLSMPEQLTNPANYMSHLNSLLSHLLPVLVNYVRNAQGMELCLQAIEDLTGSSENLRNGLQKLLHLLYDKEVIDEQAIFKWYKNPDPESTIAQDLRKQVAPLIKWLEEADEESSEG